MGIGAGPARARERHRQAVARLQASAHPQRERRIGEREQGDWVVAGAARDDAHPERMRARALLGDALLGALVADAAGALAAHAVRRHQTLHAEPRHRGGRAGGLDQAVGVQRPKPGDEREVQERVGLVHDASMAPCALAPRGAARPAATAASPLTR